MKEIMLEVNNILPLNLNGIIKNAVQNIYKSESALNVYKHKFAAFKTLVQG